MPVFDPQEDTRMFTYHLPRYYTNGVDITSTSIDESKLSWYDRMKREMGTDHSWFKAADNSWIFQTPFMNDTQHTSPKGNEYLSFYYESWMKTVLMCY